MKTLRLVILILTCIAIVFLSLGFLLPEKIHVERSIYINVPQHFAYNQINTVKNWKHWSSWLTADTLTDIEYSGPEYGAGAGFTWKSRDKNLGKGSLTILYTKPADSLLFISDYGEMGKLAGRILLREENQGVIVTWIVETDLRRNPLSRWVGLFSDNMVGPDLMKSLFNLKQDLEKPRLYSGFRVTEFEIPARIILSIRDTASPTNVSLKLAAMGKKISKYLKFRSLSPTGSPFTVYHFYSDSIFDIESCIPIPIPVTNPKGMTCSEQNTKKIVMVRQFGYNKEANAAYIALNNYITDRGLIVSGPPWEEYVTNPVQIGDTAKWQTNIYFPLK